MRNPPMAEASRQGVLALMRKGLSDEDIAKVTGLSLLELLELRAAAAVQDRRQGQHPGR